MASRAWTPNHFDWRVADALAGADEMARKLRVAPLVAALLHNRGIDDVAAARAFLEPKLDDLHDPSLLAGAESAARRIVEAMKTGRKIVLYGDYDVDGITGVAILHACLELIRPEGCIAEVDFYVPHRIDEGYGLNEEAVDKLIAAGTDLIVTVDCGVGAVDEVARARAAGVDVIITDHHRPGDVLPDACEIVHPALAGPGRGGKKYPNENLCGAGVAFKLAWQIAREVCGEQRVDEKMRNFLLDATSLAALGTIADVVPLVGENRVLASFGLRSLPATGHVGLRALLETAGLLGDGKKIDTYDVGFRLAPRLNAAGRMGHAKEAVELLTRADPRRALEIAEYLARQNTKRQKVEREITEEAVEMVRSHGLDSADRRTIVLGSENWHGGVIGICASRLVDRFARPTVLVALNGLAGQGSGRSVEGFDMHAALTSCAAHLSSFGGHAMAGGVRIRSDRLEAFAHAMERYALEHIACASRQPVLRVDVETTLSALDFPTVERLVRLAPLGRGNPPPIVAIRNCKVLNPPRRIGKTGRTVMMVLGDGRVSMRAVGFGMGDLPDHLIAGINTIDVAAQPVLNTFRGRTTVELQLHDVKW